MRLRILLPPTLAGCVQRNAIPAKIELEDEEGDRISPEKADHAAFGELSDSERSSLFALSQWCGGKISSFIQLDLAQAGELLKLLHEVSCFYPANNPDQAIEWANGELLGVSDFIPLPETERPRPVREIRDEPEEEPEPVFDEPEYEGPPIEVEGSTEYLRLILPSTNHPGYKKVLRLMREWNFLRDRNHRHWWWLRDPSKVLDFLATHQEELELDYEAEFTDNFRQLTSGIQRAELSTSASESDEDGAEVEVRIEAGDVPPDELEHALATGQNHVRHGNKVYLLTRDLLDKATELQRRISGNPDALLLARASHRVEKFQAPSVEDFLLQADPRFQPPARWKKRSAALRDLSSLPSPSLDKTLESILRPYQKTGVAWLLHLFRNELGGILADEMGLGKTLQALGLLTALRMEQGFSKTSLVVCPATLLENWRREAQRFCPDFSVLVHHGPDRAEESAALGKPDLVITSYGTLVRDLDLFQRIPFLCVIGDEAQHLKNRKTQNAQAMASLSSDGRVLLTGTPIENSVSDLLSLLEFLLPGARPELPPSSRGDERIWHEQRILKEAAPYLLRRSKREVAPELPEKIEQILFLDLTEEQAACYDEVKRSAETELDKMADAGASEGAMRMKTLTQLLRLRQTCCDPRLLKESFPADQSAKLNAFRELLYTCLEGNHRMLVFSQFVQVLQLLKAELEAASLPFCYLDGSSKDRMAQVDRFQEDNSVPVFLISLKAGGTGLNLTAADVVVHFDPWWNPAAEAQASDRAHRIGQDKQVTVYKLITSGTVEERVLGLQQGKRKLLEQIFEESEAANLSLGVEDLRELI
ncbi:MAG: serine/threonine protein kinase [Opitutae bacterium]|nr:serine/threonine protein kinase [Opitutae bacterium]